MNIRKAWLCTPALLIALLCGCSGERERGMNKDKGFPRQEPVKSAAKAKEPAKDEPKKEEGKKSQN